MLEIVIAVGGVLIAFLAWQYPKFPSQSSPQDAERPTNVHNLHHSDQLEQRGVIPKGVTMGHNVLLVPGLLAGFSHSGDLMEKLEENGLYFWVNRGDPIAKYTIKPKGTFFGGTSTPETVEIPAPASGLVLHHYLRDHPDWPKAPTKQADLPLSFSMLLPDDEHAPLEGKDIFRAVSRLASDHKSLFLEASRLWSLGPMTHQEFETMISEQLSRNCATVEALPRFREYLEEARTRRPYLRQHLKHLA